MRLVFSAKFCVLASSEAAGVTLAASCCDAPWAADSEAASCSTGAADAPTLAAKANITDSITYSGFIHANDWSKM